MSIKHVIEEGSREHVVWWNTDGAHCSEPDCEMNNQKKGIKVECPYCKREQRGVKPSLEPSLEQEKVMSEHTTEETLMYLRQHLLPGGVQDGIDLEIPSWLVREVEARLSKMKDALEHCGYDPTDCIDCGGPPHNEWCRFWKLRDFVPALFDLASQEEDLNKLTTQQKPTEEAMEEA